MTAEDAARLGVRLLAIWFVVSAITSLSGIGSVDASMGGYAVVVGISIAAAATQVGAAVIAWKYARWLAERICVTRQEPASSTDWSPASATQAAVGVVGVALLSEAAPQALWIMVAIVAAKLTGPSPLAGQPAYDAQMGLYAVGGIAHAAAILARLAIGVVLIARASSVSSLILVADRRTDEQRAAEQGDEADEA